jgi:hypothetical protein
MASVVSSLNPSLFHSFSADVPQLISLSTSIRSCGSGLLHPSLFRDFSPFRRVRGSGTQYLDGSFVKRGRGAWEHATNCEMGNIKAADSAEERVKAHHAQLPRAGLAFCQFRVAVKMIALLKEL